MKDRTGVGEGMTGKVSLCSIKWQQMCPVGNGSKS